MTTKAGNDRNKWTSIFRVFYLFSWRYSIFLISATNVSFTKIHSMCMFVGPFLCKELSRPPQGVRTPKTFWNPNTDFHMLVLLELMYTPIMWCMIFSATV